MENRQRVNRNFGKPLDDSVLLEFATVDNQDIESALEWWDANASPEWQGALENNPINKRNNRQRR